MKIAILYIGIGKYIDFWKGFYLSCENHFLKDDRKDYFVFSDAEKIYAEEKENIIKLYQNDMGWPGNSLLRYSFFLKIIDKLENYDYIYFFNGNVLFLQDISREEFCPDDDSLLVVEHHYFVGKPNTSFPYDRNNSSTAYIPMGEGEHYVCGGMNGAKTPVFIKFIQELYQRIEIDNKNNVVALWHDESHVNRYILDNKKIKLMDPSYCYPELVANPEISSERKIICRDKRKYFNLYRFKNPEQEFDSLIADSNRLLREEHYEKLFKRWLSLKVMGISIGQYFTEREITHISVVLEGNAGRLFYSELSYKDVIVLKVIDEQYVNLFPYGKELVLDKKYAEKHYATVVTDTFNFSHIYEIMVLRGEKNIISLEDIINRLYEKHAVRIKQVIEKKVGFVPVKEKSMDITLDLWPINELPEGAKIVLYGGGKVGARYYEKIKYIPSLSLVFWIDADYRKKQQEGLPIHSVDNIKDIQYDYVILGTKVKDVIISMVETLKLLKVDLKKVIWYNREINKWEAVTGKDASFSQCYNAGL